MVAGAASPSGKAVIEDPVRTVAADEPQAARLVRASGRRTQHDGLPVIITSRFIASDLHGSLPGHDIRVQFQELPFLVCPIVLLPNGFTTVLP